MEYSSQMGQDRWVLNVLKHKKGGTFVDIGAGHPVDINNTVVLEKDYGWSGVSFDIGPPHTHGCWHLSTVNEYEDLWKSERSTNLICGNALEVDYKDVFEKNELQSKIDYLSMDLDPPFVTYECLLKIPFDKYQFEVVTFETDYYREKRTQEPSRRLMRGYGYVLKEENDQEDWYVHESYSFPG
jgi:hypothetical protein